MAQKSEIPFGAQFSPNQVNLPKLLQLVHDRAGDRGKITEAIRDEFFAEHSPTQRWKLADNTVLALRAYGLLDEQGANPTRLASELLAIADEAELYEQFAAARIGLGVQFKPNVIVIVSTGDFTRKARHYRDIVLGNTNLQLVLLDSLDIKSLSRQSVTINQLLARETRKASRIKDSQLSAFHCSSMEFCL